jgi:hypothetical protein
MRQLSIVVPVALLLIMILLHLALGSFRHAFLVLLNLPFALVGGVVAVVAFGMPLSVRRGGLHRAAGRGGAERRGAGGLLPPAARKRRRRRGDTSRAAATCASAPC